MKPRHERVDRSQYSFSELQPITIHFDGEISPRKTSAGANYTLPLFWARPGDVVLSKIDLKNGAVGVLPEGWNNAVVTSHFKVYVPDTERLDPRYFRLLLQTQDFKKWLWANRSGADGRTEVKLDVFEALAIPVPSLARQKNLCDAYANAQKQAAQLEQEADAIERAGWLAFEEALGLAPPPPLPDAPVFVARFKDMEQWTGKWGESSELASRYPLLPLSKVLIARREPVEIDGALGDWQAITIKFSGEVLPRNRTDAFKGAMFAAYPGDIVFSKIDARNGAVGLIPDSIPQAVVTSEYPVFTPKADKVRAAYLSRLLRAEHFRNALQRKASGTSGRKRITPKGFLSLAIPVPPLAEQDVLVSALSHAARLKQQAASLRQSAWEQFEAALFVTTNLL